MENLGQNILNYDLHKVCKVGGSECIKHGPLEKFYGHRCLPCWNQMVRERYQQNKMSKKEQSEMAYGLKHYNYSLKLSIMENYILYMINKKKSQGHSESDIIKTCRVALEDKIKVEKK